MAPADPSGSGTRRSLVTRVVVLAVAVAAVSTVVSTTALVLVSRQGNLDQASALAQREVQQLALLDDQRLDPSAQSVGAFRKALATRGAVTELALPARGFAVVAPFAPQDVDLARQGATGATERTAGGRRWMVAWAPSSRRVALVAEPVTDPAWLTRRQVIDVALMALASLLGGALAGLLLARSVTRPLARLAEAARRLGAGQRRLELVTDGPREVDEVAAALDQLSQALARSEDRQRRFLLAVSHELRTPLTAVTGYAEAMADGDITGGPPARWSRGRRARTRGRGLVQCGPAGPVTRPEHCSDIPRVVRTPGHPRVESSAGDTGPVRGVSMSVRSVFVMAVPAVLVAAVAVAGGAHASAAAPQAVALSGSAVSAGATAVSPGASTGPGALAVASLTGEENWSQLCARVGKAMAKASAADTRLHAGADTKGSLARLQARLDAATKAGDADRVRVLTDLMAMRTSRATTVTVRVAKLGDIHQVCAAHTR